MLFVIYTVPKANLLAMAEHILGVHAHNFATSSYVPSR